jgi:hypothetical protein
MELVNSVLDKDLGKLNYGGVDGSIKHFAGDVSSIAPGNSVQA